MIDEKELSTALHHLAASDETGTATIDGLLRRGRRARFHRTIRVAGLAVVTVGLAAGLTAVAQPDEPGPVPLDLAAQTSQRTTFRFEQTLSARGSDGDVLMPAGAPYQGAYDPVHDRGYRIRATQSEPRVVEERQIGDACYHHAGQGPWYVSSMSAERPACWRLAGSAESSAFGVSASPGDLLAELEHVGEVNYTGRTGTGRNKVDTYRFTYRYAPDMGLRFQRTFEKHGPVDIDVATRRIIHLAYVSQDVTGDGKYVLSASEELTFSDFGKPVVVKAPTNIVRR